MRKKPPQTLGKLCWSVKTALNNINKAIYKESTYGISAIKARW